MSTFNVYALKTEHSIRDELTKSLQGGVGRFGWSYIANADMYKLRERISRNGWSSLTSEEKDCYQPFLLDIREGDYVVYINLPSYGKCTLAKVVGPYYWKHESDDFNHRFKVAPSSIAIFDRNDSAVHPHLSARLKLQGRYWRIYAKNEFSHLLKAIETGGLGKPASIESSVALLSEEIKPYLLEITRKIHHTNPNFGLEQLVRSIFLEMPQVVDVRRFHGSGDKGADLIVTFEQGLNIAGIREQKTCIVQIKSYSGEQWDTKAVSDLRSAFNEYPDTEFGIIISTADSGSENLQDAIEELENEMNKKVHLMIGEDVAVFLLSNAAKLLGKFRERQE